MLLMATVMFVPLGIVMFVHTEAIWYSSSMSALIFVAFRLASRLAFGMIVPLAILGNFVSFTQNVWFVMLSGKFAV